MSKNNGTTSPDATPAADTSSVLDKLNKEFETTFKGKTNPKRVKELVAALTSAQAARAKAEKSVEDAIKAESDAAKNLIREACGKNKVTISGNLYSPMSRGERVFFRKESGEAIDLG